MLTPDIKESVVFLMDHNPIRFNENRNVYSAVINQLVIDFYLPFEEKK